jgi:very-short-patch-repair endonuclease
VLRYPETALSFRSGAWAHDLRLELGGPVHLSSKTDRRDTAGIRVHQVRNVEIETQREGLPCTPLAQTLLDCATVCSEQELHKLIDRAEELRTLDLRRLTPFLNEKHGSPALRTALELYQAAEGTRSELERRFAELTAELPQPERNVFVGPHRVDAVWWEERVAVELDSRVHLKMRKRVSDGRRDAWLQRHGWRVVRFTWFDVVEDPGYVLQTLGALLERD